MHRSEIFRNGRKRLGLRAKAQLNLLHRDILGGLTKCALILPPRRVLERIKNLKTWCYNLRHLIKLPAKLKGVKHEAG